MPLINPPANVLLQSGFVIVDHLDGQVHERLGHCAPFGQENPEPPQILQHLRDRVSDQARSNVLHAPSYQRDDFSGEGRSRPSGQVDKERTAVFQCQREAAGSIGNTGVVSAWTAGIGKVA